MNKRSKALLQWLAESPENCFWNEAKLKRSDGGSIQHNDIVSLIRNGLVKEDNSKAKPYIYRISSWGKVILKDMRGELVPPIEEQTPKERNTIIEGDFSGATAIQSIRARKLLIKR